MQAHVLICVHMHLNIHNLCSPKLFVPKICWLFGVFKGFFLFWFFSAYFKVVVLIDLIISEAGLLRKQ